MARWKLTEPHYLNCPGTFWEQVLTDRVTQRPIRKQFPVPLFLDPRIEGDWNFDSDGERPVRNGDMDGSIMVCWEGKGQPRDIVFIGDPTPGMLPMDDEAREISAKFTWTPTQGLDDQAQMASNQAHILDGLIKKMADATVAGPAAPAGFEKFMESMALMMQQQTLLLAALLGKQQEGEFQAQAKAIGAEPPVEDEPLDEPEPPTKEELEIAASKAALAEKASIEKAAEHARGRRV